MGWKAGREVGTEKTQWVVWGWPVSLTGWLGKLPIKGAISSLGGPSARIATGCWQGTFFQRPASGGAAFPEGELPAARPGPYDKCSSSQDWRRLTG